MRRAVTTILSVALLVPAASVRAGTPEACYIVIPGTIAATPTLQAAVDAAPDGATIEVQGECTGATTIAKNLTIRGIFPNGGVQPALLGGGTERPLTVDGAVTVTIRDILVAGGSDGSPLAAGNLWVKGGATVTLANVQVRDGSAPNAGNVRVGTGAILTIKGDSRVTGGTASGTGGNIHNDGGDLRISGSTVVSGGSADMGGNIASTGTLRISGSVQVKSGDATIGGGGVYVDDGTAEITDDVRITKNRLGDPGPTQGGGILVQGGTLTVSGKVRIDRNRATTGGGIDLDTGKVTLTGDARVEANQATGTSDDGIRGGGGVNVWEGTLVLKGDARIEENTSAASGSAGGLQIHAAGVVKVGSSVVTCSTQKLKDRLIRNEPRACKTRG